jgi:hypothetical protein
MVLFNKWWNIGKKVRAIHINGTQSSKGGSAWQKTNLRSSTKEVSIKLRREPTKCLKKKR